jgi:hypothetical protein
LALSPDQHKLQKAILIGYHDDTDPFDMFLVASIFEENAAEIFGRPVDVIPMLSRDAGYYVLVEALLTCECLWFR